MIRSWLSIAILFAIVIVGFLSLFLRTSEAPALAPDEPVRIGNVAYGRSFSGGVHLIEGTASVPTRCTSLEATAAAAQGTGGAPVIRVELSAARDQDVCLRLPAERRFSVSVEAPEDSSLEFFGNGEPLSASIAP